MANSSIETSFQNLVNVIKEKTYPATSGAAVEADIANIKIDITDLGISKIGISQIGMPGGVAPTNHTHTKSQITDFPESMPASDVHAWAKAANKPDYTPVEIGAIGISQIGMANGVASLGNDGKVPSSQLPAMTIPVTSVNNKTGDVVLTPSDIGALGISQVGMANGVASLDENGKIPASQLPDTGSDAYRYNIVTKSTGGSDASITIKKYLNEELVSSTDYPYQTFDHTHVIIDSFFDMIYAEDGQAKYTMTLLEDSTDHTAGYSKRWGYNEVVDFSETFIMSDEDISFIAPPFYANVSYAVGDKVTRNGSFYRCKTPHTGAWDIADFDKISVDELFDEVYDSLDDIQISIDQLGISKIGISQVGMANGVAGLDSNGKLLRNQTNYVSAGQKANTTLGAKATAEGNNTTASGDNSHAEGVNTKATNTNAHAEGSGTTSSSNSSHAEGVNTTASGSYAHAEGSGTTASGNQAHAEGYTTTASGPASHAEGYWAKAEGSQAHAEGYETKASHDNSHAEGYGTKTGRSNQHVMGQYNEGKATTVMEIGWGNSNNNRLNIFEVDTDGNLVVTGDITDGDGNALADMLGISKVGMANGVASLGNDGKVPLSQLPPISGDSGLSIKDFQGVSISGLYGVYGNNFWTDGDDVYYSYNNDQYVLNKTTGEWEAKIWTGLTYFDGRMTWTDGNDIYYSSYQDQYVLDKATSTWTAKTWNGFSNLDGRMIWKYNGAIYYSDSGNQYMLDVATSTWIEKSAWTSWGLDGRFIWIFNDTVYSSNGVNQFILDVDNDTLTATTWNISYIDGDKIWTDGKSIYYTYDGNNYVLDEDNMEWDAISLSINPNGEYIWTNGEHTYYSYSDTYEFVSIPVMTADSEGNITTIGDITDGSGNTLSSIGACVPSGASSSNKFATMNDIPSVPSVPSASDANPVMNGTVSPGDSSDYSRANHVHPSDTSKLDVAGGYVNGNIAPNTDNAIDFGLGDHRYHYGYFRRLCAVESICNSTVANTNRIDLPSKTGTMALTSDIPTITAQTTDPGAGSALTTGNLILVYEA